MNCSLRNRLTLLLPTLVIASCSGSDSPDAHPITVKLNRDSSAVVISGLDHELITDITSDPADSTAWESLFQVFKETKNEDLRGLEPSYPGKYTVNGDILVFKPDSGFLSPNTYRAELNIPDSFSKEELISQDKPPGNTPPREFRFIFN